MARALVRLACLAMTLALHGAAAAACPFCNAVTPTFAERRENAAVCALAEAIDEHDGRWRFEIHRIHQGEGRLKSDALIQCRPNAVMQPGDLALLLGSTDDEDAAQQWRWQVTKVDFVSYRYFSAAPDLRQPAAERLAYFVPFLESAETDIASDAFAELGRAPLEAVEAVVSNREIAAKLRTWILSDELANERRGGYGLMLALAKSQEDSAANANTLRTAIEQQREDFRAGFDGLLAGYLLLEPVEALQLIDERYIANADARPGDTRHALHALRFCIEYARGPNKEAILAVMRHGLHRPAFAPDVVTDLARWQDWSPVDEIAALFETSGEANKAPLQRAVIGYLKACPTTRSRDHLERLRANDPQTVSAIERRLTLPLDR